MGRMFQDSKSNARHPLLQGRRVALGKQLAITTRSDWKRLIKQHGGYPVDQIDDFTDVLLVGQDEERSFAERDFAERDFSEPDFEKRDLAEQAIGGSASAPHELTDLPVPTFKLSADTNRQPGSLAVMAEAELWQLLSGDHAAVDLSRYYTPQMLAGLLDVSVATIRRWHRRGLIVPVHQVNKLPYFDFQEIASARRIARWIQNGQSPAAIERQLITIAEASGDDRPLSQLSIIVRGRQVLLRAGEGLTSATGQMHFNFDDGVAFEPVVDRSDQHDHDQRHNKTDDPSDRDDDGELTSSMSAALLTISPPEASEATRRPDRPSVLPFVKFEDFASHEFDKSPDEFIRWATELEDDGDPAAALEVYRAMALAHGSTPDVSFRIAELLYQIGDLSAARERYYFAIELDETFVEARASLGCVLAEQGKNELALAAFRGALDYHLNFADVHFHLARLLDEMGRTDEAVIHWDAFLQLAPKSPWAQEARVRLSDDR